MNFKELIEGLKDYTQGHNKLCIQNKTFDRKIFNAKTLLEYVSISFIIIVNSQNLTNYSFTKTIIE